MKCQLCQVFVRILEDVKEKENKIMARKDYDQFADELIAAVGGKENIVSVTNCMTRLRFVLADESIVKDDEVKKIKGVMSVVHGAGQYQIPIGTYVSDLCPVVKAKLGLTEDAMAAGKAKAESMRVVKKDSFFNKFFKAISGCILPMIAPMAAGGIIKGFLTILTTFGVLTSDNGIYLILYAAADALMYFMPIIVGFSAGKVFGMNPYTAAVIGAAMLYPKLTAFVGAEETLTFFGLKVTMLDYSQTLLPILLAVFVAFIGATVISSQLARPMSRLIQPALERSITQVLEEQTHAVLPPPETSEASQPPALSDAFSGEEGQEGEEDWLAQLPLDEVLDALQASSLYQHFIQPIQDAIQDGVMEVTTSAARAVADYLALELTRMFLFLVSFALVLLLWLLLSRVLDLACKLPVLSTLNHWSGAALGLVKGGLIVFILCWLLRGSLISQEAVEGTVLLRFFCTHTPLSLLAPLLFR